MSCLNISPYYSMQNKGVTADLCTSQHLRVVILFSSRGTVLHISSLSMLVDDCYCHDEESGVDLWIYRGTPLKRTPQK